MSPPRFSTFSREVSCYPTVITISIGWLGRASRISLILSLSLASVPLCSAEVHRYRLVVISPWCRGGIKRGSRWCLV